MNAPRICIKCRETLPPEVTFCASCGFDNGEFLRMQKYATFDEKIENRLNWLRFKQALLRFFWWGRV